MRTNNFPFVRTSALALAVALLGVGCDSGTTNSDDRDDTTSGAPTGTGTTVGPTTSTGTNPTTGSNTAQRDRTDVSVLDPNTIVIVGAEPGTPMYNERYAASKDMRGYRALLMTELDAIRARLNDGTRAAEEAKKDQERAADLAQGLERMDRLIKAVEESDDMTWTSIRESQLKEAGEVRVWATEHGYKLS